jgi:hypothetical protein
VKNLPPQRQTLEDIGVLLAVIMRQPRTIPPTPNGKTRFRILWLSRREVFLQVPDHLLAGFAIRTKEGVIVTDTIQALLDILLRQAIPFVTRGQDVDGAFFGLDILLNVAS